jgi:lipoyl(octanoyl) transferase
VGIWVNNNEKIEKIAAIGVRVSKWIAYHGFSLNIKNSLNPFKSIVPCGISDRGVTNLKKISEQNYEKIQDILIEKFLTNLKSLNA